MNSKIESYLAKASVLAQIYIDEFVTPEHVLMAMISGSEEKEFPSRLRGLGVDVEELADDLTTYFIETKCAKCIKRDKQPTFSACLEEALDKIAQYNKPNRGGECVNEAMFMGLATCGSEWIPYCFNKQGVEIMQIIAIMGRIILSIAQEKMRVNIENKETTDEKSGVTVKITDGGALISGDIENMTDSDIKKALATAIYKTTGQRIRPEDITTVPWDSATGVDIMNAPEIPISGMGGMENGQREWEQPEYDNREMSGRQDGHDRQGDEQYEQRDYGKSDIPYTLNLSERRSANAIHYIGRENDIDKCLDILCRLEKSNILITGEPGIGKTSFINGIIDACDRVEKADARYEKVKSLTFFKLDVQGLKAGASFAGELDKRVRGVVTKLLSTYQSPVLFVDEIDSALDSKRSENNIMGMLKPYLVGGRLKYIGTCSESAYSTDMCVDSEIMRRFTRVMLEEPTVEESVKILVGIRKAYEKHHSVKYSKKALEHVVKLSKKYIKDRFLPDKAIDIMDEAGVLCMKQGKSAVTQAMIETVISKRCNVAETEISKAEIDKVKNLERNIGRKVFGQAEAVKDLAKYIKISKAGLAEDNKPIGSFLFIGPTGVGKTEVARVLAKELGVDLVKLDMAEYSEEHTVTKLIGSPPSYVGYGDGSILVKEIQKHPNCVLLLDEIEKAHPVIYNTLLQIMDDAVFTDSRGTKVYFNDVVLIMTSNCGAADAERRGIGFGASVKDDELMKHVESNFTPEFRGRLSSIVKFNKIDGTVSRKIVDKFVNGIKDKLRDRNVAIELSSDAYDYIINKGFDSSKGARGIQIVIDRELKTIISEEIVAGKVKSNSKLNIVFNSESLVCRVS